MYLRFVRPTLINGMAVRCATQVNDLLDWFRENLAEPERFTRSAFRATGSAEFTKGLSWFKPEATDMLAKARDLITLLQDNGYPTCTLRSARIGYVLFEDAHQIVAEPFADTPK